MGDQLDPEDELQHPHLPLDYAGGHIHRPSRPRLERISSIGPIVEEPPLKFPTCRLILMLMAFFAFLNIYCLRVNLSVALVAMVNTSYIRELEGDHHDDYFHGNSSNATVDPDAEIPCPISTAKVAKDSGTFNWDTNKQGIILASFFYGYITTQILGGVLAQKFGGKRLLLFGIGWTAVLTILTPVLTIYGDFPALVATRVLEGIGEGVTYPSMHAMLSKWAPPMERSKMVTSVYAGAQIGTVIAMPISGLLSDWSWESVFYVFGALGLIWSVMWIFLTYDSPSQHPRIEPAEREYIESSQGLLLDKKKGSLRTPWLSFATSLPVYATAVAHFCNNWGYYTLLTCLPAYLKYILKFDIKSNGALSGLPYLVMWLMMIVGGLLADLLRTKHILSTTAVRKLFNAVGFLGPAACLVGTGYIECDAGAAVTLIVIAVGLSGLSMAGWGVNHLDLAPPFAGTLMGITNMVATIPGFVGPSVVGAFTYKNQTRKAWRNVFFVSAAVYVFGTVFYCIFGSGQKQPWAIQSTVKDEPKTPPTPTKKESSSA